MLAKKDIIIRVLLGFAFIFFTLKVLGPIFINYLKTKMPGYQPQENDIDAMIRRQKERLRLQYGLPDTGSSDVGSKLLKTSTEADQSLVAVEAPKSEVITGLYKETRWGGGEFLKSIQSLISKNYSYTIADSKVNSFILLSEKRKVLRFLSDNNQNNLEAIRNYLSLLLIFMMMIEEVRSKDYTIISKIAKKCHMTPEAFALALQMKILAILSTKKNITEEKVYSANVILHQFAEESMTEAIESILRKEANIWARGHSLFIEEMALYINYATIIVPVASLTHKKDVENARLILGVKEDSTLDDIKKTYKKLALTRHPDILASQKLPKVLEKKAAQNFTMIQTAYDLLLTQKNKG